jgi:hypothetical protein
MQEDSKGKQLLQIPVWYLQLDSKNSKYSFRVLILTFILLFGVYALLPLISPEYNIQFQDVYQIYIIIYIAIAIAILIIWKYFVKSFNLTTIEYLSYRSMALAINIRKIILNKNLNVNIKKNIKFLKKIIKICKDDFTPSTDQNLINIIERIINNLNKLNAYKENKVYNQIYNNDIDTSLYYISEKIYLSNSLTKIEKELNDFSNVLSKIPEVKITERIKNWEQFVSDYFTIIGFIAILFSGTLSYLFPAHKEIFLAIFGVLLAVWLGNLLMKRSK